MSNSYWDLAEKFKSQAIDEIESHKSGVYSVYVFPCIIMYCSAVEAFVNECLSLKESQSTDPEIKRSMASIRKGLGENKRLIVKIRNAYQSINVRGTRSLNKHLLDDFQVLSEVRNAIIHYNPEVIDILKWPTRLQKAFKVSKVQPVIGDWTITFRTKEIAIWASATSGAILKEFLKIGGIIDEDNFFNN